MSSAESAPLQSAVLARASRGAAVRMSRFRSQLSRLNAALAKRVLSELPHRPCSDTTLLRAVRNCAETGQGRLTVALYEGYRDTQTLPLKPELAAQLIRSLGTERLPHAPAAAGMAPLEHVRHPHRMRHPFASMRLPMRMLLQTLAMRVVQCRRPRRTRSRRRCCASPSG